jgi:hypothetical protein
MAASASADHSQLRFGAAASAASWSRAPVARQRRRFRLSMRAAMGMQAAMAAMRPTMALVWSGISFFFAACVRERG